MEGKTTTPGNVFPTASVLGSLNSQQHSLLNSIPIPREQDLAAAEAAEEKAAKAEEERAKELSRRRSRRYYERHKEKVKKKARSRQRASKSKSDATAITCSYPGCDFKALYPSTLRNHARKHTKERPFSCPVCHARFAQKGNMKAHLKRKHPDAPLPS